MEKEREEITKWNVFEKHPEETQFFVSWWTKKINVIKQQKLSNIFGYKWRYVSETVTFTNIRIHKLWNTDKKYYLLCNGTCL